MGIHTAHYRGLRHGAFLAGTLLAAASIFPAAASGQERGPQAAKPGGHVRLNRVIELIENGTPALGIFAWNVSPRGAAALASSRLDFVIIDLEHTPFDMTRLETYLLAMVDKRRILEKGNLQPDVVPIVRIPANGREHVQYMIKQVLDLGAFGLLVPHIDTAEEALAAVRATRFAQPAGARHIQPGGQRGVGYGWAARYWGIIGDLYPAKADVWPLDPGGELLLWCMIESRDAVENVRAIASTPGVGGLFVGPSDLSFSLGVPPSDPRVEEAIRKVLSACKETGVPCGTFTSAEGVATRLRQGFRFLAVGVDSGLPCDVEQALQIGRQRKP
jgi:4-hydroxy-2-oxoheptanedioate aldolase